MLLLHCAYLLQCSTGRLLETSGPVEATASSTYELCRIEFSPQLAIQGDTSLGWANCFVSAKEPNPWFTLRFKSLTSVFNVWLKVRKIRKHQLHIDFSLKDMDNLTVYMSNSSVISGSGKQPCGSPWSYKSKRVIELDCGTILKGKFLHITVPSTSPKYLVICSIVLNRENGLLFPLQMSEGRAAVSASGYNSARPPTLAIDGIPSIGEKSCSMITGKGTTWLRVDVQTVRFIGKVGILLYESKGKNPTIVVGRGLRHNGAIGNTNCGIVSSVISESGRKITCSTQALGQFIYIESKCSSMRICEIEVFYENILNIYSPIQVTASDQRCSCGSIWKPIDGVRGPMVYSSWISLTSLNSWWRMEFPNRNAISRVIIYLPILDFRRRITMNGFTVHIGDSPLGNGKSNAICGGPYAWNGSLTRIITVACEGSPLGKYLYVVAADRPGAALYLAEISVFECEGQCYSTGVLFKDTFNHLPKFQSTLWLEHSGVSVLAWDTCTGNSSSVLSGSSAVFGATQDSSRYITSKAVNLHRARIIHFDVSRCSWPQTVWAINASLEYFTDNELSHRTLHSFTCVDFALGILPRSIQALNHFG